MTTTTASLPEATPVYSSASESAPLPGARSLVALGTLAIALGGIGFVACSIVSAAHRECDGTIPACSLVLLLFGFALRFPTLLQDGSKDSDGTGNLSTMRVAVLSRALHRGHVRARTIKSGWNTPALSELRIDTSWAWVLAVALGGKALQSFAEFQATK